MPPFDTIIRSIEFPPEYHQAGMSLLQAFGRAVRIKYPDKKAKIRIEQDDLKVKMIVEPIEGDPEIFEKALNEYGLVVTGKLTPEEYTDNRDLILELKTELRLAQVRIEAQKDILEYQKSDIKVLRQIIDNAVRHPIPISIKSIATSHLESEISVDIEIANQIPLILGGLNELKEQLPQGSEEANSIEELQQSFDQIDKSSLPDEVAKSSAMSKFRRFLTELGDDNSNLGKTIKGIKKGTDIAKELAGHYNQIAQWCGLPVVPVPFSKKK
jgi:hypothetical protein